MDSPQPHPLRTLDAPISLRPVRVWLALARQRGMVGTPAQATRFLRMALQAVQDYGHPITLDALWMGRDGRVELIFPNERRTSSAWCLTGIGLLACELVSGDYLPDSTHSSLALAHAKSSVEAKQPCGWDPSLGYFLGRLLGQGLPFQSPEEALDELEFLFSPEVPQLGHDPASDLCSAKAEPIPVPEPTAVQPKQQTWVQPLAIGFGGALGLGVSLAVAMHFGARQVPVALQAPTPGLVLDQAGLLALAKSLRPAETSRHSAVPVSGPPKQSTKPSLVAAQSPKQKPSPPALEAPVDDGPVYVAEPAPEVARGSRLSKVRDPRQVQDGDFVARN